MKLALATIKFVGMNSSPALFIDFLRNDRVKHLVINHVLKEPGRNKRRVQKRVYADDPILFLDGAKNKVFFWGNTSLPSPSDAVMREQPAKIFSINFVEKGLQIKVFTLRGKLQLALQRKPFKGQFSLSLSHRRSGA